MTEIKKEKVPALIRINSRIKREHHEHIKALAKETGKTEGEVLRDILDKQIKKNKLQ